METITNITLEEFLSVIRLENGDHIPYVLVDMDGNWIKDDDLFILDFYQVRKWIVESVIVKEDGTFEITLNGGNFDAFHLRNVFHG